MRYVLLSLYLLLVTGAWIGVARRAPPPAPLPSGSAAALVAARELAPNRLLMAGDLRPAEDPMKEALGRYVVGAGAAVPAGAPAPALAAQPDLWTAPYSILVTLPLPAALDPRDHNAGRAVRICHPVLTTPAPATIRALRCGPAGGGCVAVLEVAPSMAGRAAPALSQPGRATICPS